MTHRRRTIPRHGTQARQSLGCTCEPCRAAHRETERRRRRAIAYGVHQPNSVPAAGTRRRVLALMLNGWSMRALAARAGIGRDRLSTVLTHERVGRINHARVVALYDELWDQLAPRTTKGERVSAARAVGYARRAGAAPAMAWDDDSIDDPDATPDLGAESSSWDRQPCGTTAAARRHYRCGEPLDEACRAAERRAHAERRHSPSRIGAAA